MGGGYTGISCFGQIVDVDWVEVISTTLPLHIAVVVHASVSYCYLLHGSSLACIPPHTKHPIWVLNAVSGSLSTPPVNVRLSGSFQGQPSSSPASHPPPSCCSSPPLQLPTSQHSPSLPNMQPNWQQQGSFGGYSSFGGGGNTGQGGPGGFQQPQQTGMPSFMSSQPTGFPQQQQQQQRPGGNLSFLNAPPPSGSFGPQPTGFSGMGNNLTGPGAGGFSGMTPQMTGYPGGGASGLMPQQTGYPGLMSQPTGFGGGGGGLMPQQTGFGGGLRAQPTGFQDPRLASMMQSFMPSNTSQVSLNYIPPTGRELPAVTVASGVSVNIPAIRGGRRPPIQSHSAEPTSHIHLPIASPKPIGQNAQSPLGAFETGEEGL